MNASRGRFRDKYLWEPTFSDLKRKVEINTLYGFLGMLGALDYIHWTWKKCPTTWQGQFQNKNGVGNVIL